VAREREGFLKGRLLFVDKKKQKNFFYAGPWALPATMPMAQRNKSFCAAFFKKRLLPPVGTGTET
jgi:hypothetical protein